MFVALVSSIYCKQCGLSVFVYDEGFLLCLSSPAVLLALAVCLVLVCTLTPLAVLAPAAIVKSCVLEKFFWVERGMRSVVE